MDDNQYDKPLHRQGKGARESLRVDFNTAWKQFIEIMRNVYSNNNLTLPKHIYTTDSMEEQNLKIQGKGATVRTFNTSDIDILAEEPPGLSHKQLSKLENEIRNQLGETGVDFNFANPDDLEDDTAYDRPIRKHSIDWETGARRKDTDTGAIRSHKRNSRRPGH